MTDFDTLVARIRATLDTDEQIAWGASGAWGAGTPGGEHWHWVCGNCDAGIALDPVNVLDTFTLCPNCDSTSMGLRSVELYGTPTGGGLPHFVVDTEELAPADALHLARHDPVRVLTTVAALREVIEICVAAADYDDERKYVAQATLAVLDRIGADRG
jgi:uncharacterized protein DUF6221